MFDLSRQITGRHATLSDLKSWRDMISLNLNPKVRQGEQLADLANHQLPRIEQVALGA